MTSSAEGLVLTRNKTEAAWLRLDNAQKGIVIPVGRPSSGYQFPH